MVVVLYFLLSQASGGFVSESSREGNSQYPLKGTANVSCHITLEILHLSVVEVLEGFVFLLIFFLVLSISKIASGCFSVLLRVHFQIRANFVLNALVLTFFFFFFSLASRETGKIQGRHFPLRSLLKIKMCKNFVISVPAQLLAWWGKHLSDVQLHIS